ncbi:hypothetical protein FACS1894217_08020 [Clostridia bacterium]|nr:hypothetical protein FACS1894217_08020 [Clostridia bacterium]
MSTNKENPFETIDDYVTFWKEQSLETLRAIATEHMGGYNPDDTKDELVIALTKGTAAYCKAQETKQEINK